MPRFALRRAYFPTYNDREAARNFFENIIGFIRIHFKTEDGFDGGNVEEALSLCLGRLSRKIKESYLKGSHLSIG